MAPQRLEKIESAPGNGMGWDASNLQHLVRGRVADRGSLGVTGETFPCCNPLKSPEMGLESRDVRRARGPGTPRRGLANAAVDAGRGARTKFVSQPFENERFATRNRFGCGLRLQSPSPANVRGRADLVAARRGIFLDLLRCIID